MIFNWLTSSAVRQASDMHKHVRKLLDAQRDILSAQAVEAVENALRDLKSAIAGKAGDEEITKRVNELESVANKSLRPYPNASIRENVEVLLVALSVAMAIRTFFAQPFKIPTGSMQPTLFGVTPSPSPNAKNDPNLQIPGALTRFFEFWIHGDAYFNLVAPETGELQYVHQPHKLAMFNLWQDYQFANRAYRVWFPCDDLFSRAGYRLGYADSVFDPPTVKAGDPIVRLKVNAGDHLFVDRVTYNFRRPTRGEIIVFETTRITGLPQGEFYIKRLVALGGETVQIGDDRHLIIDGHRLDKSWPHFENVYSFDPSVPPRESQYSGHLNQAVADEYHQYSNLAPLFANASASYKTLPGNYMVMGDNTCNSSDSRTWGEFTRTNVIGKYFVVYWPFTSRWGWSVR